MKRLLLALALVAAACSSGDGDVQTTETVAELEPETTTTTVAPVPTQLGRDDFEASILALGVIDSLEKANETIELVAATGDSNLVPYVYDASRFGDLDTFDRAMQVLSDLTGETPLQDSIRYRSLFFGNWLMNNEPDPGLAYVDWKATLFGNVDPAFTTMIEQVDDPVAAARLQWGGVLRGGIPELNDQPTITVEEAGYMQPDEVVFGAVIDGRARAYPVRILGHHELANDTLAGRPVAMVFCTLCRTPVLFSRELNGEVLDFQTSGLLQNSNKVMVDVQTDSLWNQVTGEAFAGPLKGSQLTILPMTVTTWADWIADHPQTDVQAIPGSALDDTPPELQILGGYSYEPGDAYRDYYGTTELWFPTVTVPDYFAEKEEVLTLNHRNAQIALGVRNLVEARAVVLDVGPTRVAFMAAEGGGRAYLAGDELTVVDGELTVGDEPVTVTEDALITPAGDELFRLVSGQSFWFAWYANFPDTDWWPRS